MHLLFPPAMPAAVVTIHEMKITINVRKKIAIAGSFAGFCARFSEWFTARQKHWSVDFRKREVDNCGEDSCLIVEYACMSSFVHIKSNASHTGVQLSKHCMDVYFMYILCTYVYHFVLSCNCFVLQQLSPREHAKYV